MTDSQANSDPSATESDYYVLVDTGVKRVPRGLVAVAAILVGAPLLFVGLIMLGDPYQPVLATMAAGSVFLCLGISLLQAREQEHQFLLIVSRLLFCVAGAAMFAFVKRFFMQEGNDALIHDPALLTCLGLTAAGVALLGIRSIAIDTAAMRQTLADMSAPSATDRGDSTNTTETTQ
jgi:uncharacterized membrane protein HdeD (DUF308 family)